MIYELGEFICETLKMFLNANLDIKENEVILEKTWSAEKMPPTNSIIISFLHIEENRAWRNNPPMSSVSTNTNGNYSYHTYWLVNSNFDEYAKSLNCLDHIIAFFSTNRKFKIEVNSIFSSPVMIDLMFFDLTLIQKAEIYEAFGIKSHSSAIFQAAVNPIQ